MMQVKKEGSTKFIIDAFDNLLLPHFKGGFSKRKLQYTAPKRSLSLAHK